MLCITYDVVKRRQKSMHQICKDIIGKAESILEDIDAMETSDDLAVIEMGFDQIASWARDGSNIVLNTYDEFEED